MFPSFHEFKSEYDPYFPTSHSPNLPSNSVTPEDQNHYTYQNGYSQYSHQSWSGSSTGSQPSPQNYYQNEAQGPGPPAANQQNYEYTQYSNNGYYQCNQYTADQQQYNYNSGYNGYSSSPPLQYPVGPQKYDSSSSGAIYYANTSQSPHQHLMTPPPPMIPEVWNNTSPTQNTLASPNLKRIKTENDLKPVKKPRSSSGNSASKRANNRFNGMSEEEVAKRGLPDYLKDGLDIVFIGINPSMFAAYTGKYYDGPGNHFWQALYLSGILTEPMSAVDDHKLLDLGIGFTNIVPRTTRGLSDLSRKEIADGAEVIML